MQRIKGGLELAAERGGEQVMTTPRDHALAARDHVESWLFSDPGPLSILAGSCQFRSNLHATRIKDATMADRLSYELSCYRLREIGLLAPDDHAPMPKRVPQYDDDEPLGVRILRMRLADSFYFSDLSLPRTFFGRSGINNVSFRNSDLHESNLCWNDFLVVDFTGADLSHSDMRSSIYEGTQFAASNLGGADLRRSSFVDCIFEDAVMKGVALTRQQGSTMRLSETQRNEIDWHDEDGPEPGGG